MRLPYVDDVLLLILPALALIFTWLHHARVGAGKAPRFRSLPGSAAFSRHVGEIVEAGRPIHVATGTNASAAVGPAATTLASTLIAQRVGEAVVQRGGSVIVTTGDIAAHTAVRGTLREAYRSTGFAADYRAHRTQLVAHDTPIAYAAGVSQRYATQPIDMSLLAGDFGSEALLIAGEGADRSIPQLSAATTLSALPVLTLSTDATLIGEELFAAEAYLTAGAAPKARLLTQDALRRALVLLLVLGIIYQVLNVMLGLRLPSL